MGYETIKLEMSGAVCVLTLNRPDRLNALNVQVAHDFKAAVSEALERCSAELVELLTPTLTKPQTWK